MFRKAIRESVQRALEESGVSSPPGFDVTTPERAEHGDYATSAALICGRLAGKNPVSVAAEIVKGLKTERWLRAEAAGPGFINFRVADKRLLEALAALLLRPDEWGQSRIGEGKTAVVEYFQLNIAKLPHVGHLRSAVIGDAVKRLLLASGYNAVSDTHVGDWGTQFGILLLAYKELGEAERQAVAADPFGALERLYAEENARIEQEPVRRERAKEEFAKLERGDAENRNIWQWMIDMTMQKLEESAKRLGLLPFDEHMGESAYEGTMASMVEGALARGVARRTPDGAVVVDLTKEGLDEAVLVKSDGASTYLLRDLATIQYRKKKWDFWKNLYVVDVRQSHHFKQVFRVAGLLGFEGVGESEHISFGFMASPEGAMSTRKGTAISLDAVLEEAKKRALAVIKEKNPELQDAEAVAEAVGLGALKYFDLSHHRMSDIVFRWDDALSFDGNTGPYLQYTHARLKSILRKAANDARVSKVAKDGKLDETEHRLLVAALRLPEAIEDALRDFTPNTLANYLYHLAKLANEFYHSHPVMQEPNEAKRKARIALVSGVALTLAKGLNLLGIAAPEEM